VVSKTEPLQLAYADPVKLAIRTNFSYSYLIDCISQALLFIYVGREIEKWAKAGLRGAYEVRALFVEEELITEDVNAVIKDVSRLSGRSVTGVKTTMKLVAYDPYTIFLYESWNDASVR
jgi:hypothetical protein